MVHVIDQDKCTKCGTCLSVCPERFSAVVKVSGEEIEVPSEPIPVKTTRKEETETTSEESAKEPE